MRFPGNAAKFLSPVLAVSSFLSRATPPTPDPIPPIPEPAVAPDPADKALNNRRRRRFAQQRQESGFLSTINTAPAPGATVLR